MPALPKLITKPEASAYLTASGIPASIATLDRRIASGALPSYRVGGRVLLSKADLAAYVRSCRTGG